MAKLVRQGAAGKLKAIEEQVTEAAFSEGMGGAVADFWGVPAERRQDFQIAYSLYPLNRAKECIDMAYYFADAGSDSDIEEWLRRYERVAKTALPKWAGKKASQYLRQTRKALENEPGLISTLLDFKQFMYGVFCRALMERYSEKQRWGNDTGEAHSQVET